MSTRQEPKISYLTVLICAILVFPLISAKSAFGEEYRTIARNYMDFYGFSASYPLQFEGHVSKFVFTYKGFGLGTSGFKVCAKDLFEGDGDGGQNGDSVPLPTQNGDSGWQGKLVGLIAPAYFYYTPLGSHRKTGEVTPFVLYSYFGWGTWGLKNAGLLDFGFGIHYHMVELSVGYNSVKADYQRFFDESNETGSHPVKWSSFYVSVNLSSGPWFALRSKAIVRQEKTEKK